MALLTAEYDPLPQTIDEANRFVKCNNFMFPDMSGQFQIKKGREASRGRKFPWKEAITQKGQKRSPSPALE
jgi:hypothetical protein